MTNDLPTKCVLQEIVSDDDKSVTFILKDVVGGIWHVTIEGENIRAEISKYKHPEKTDQ